MAWAALAGLAGSAALAGFSGYQSKKASKRASRAAHAAARQRAKYLTQAKEEIQGQYETNVGYLEPYIEYGDDAREKMATYFGLRGEDEQRDAFDAFQADPGFEAEQAHGIRTIENSNAAVGLRKSGGMLKELNDYGMNLLNRYYRQRIQDLGGFEQMGRGAVGDKITLGERKARDIGNIYGGIGEAYAGGTIGAANAKIQHAQNIGNLAGYLGGQFTSAARNGVFNGLGGNGGTTARPPATGWTPTVTYG